MSEMATQVALLEQTYRNIEQERMQGLPFLNPLLNVRALAFMPWNENFVGVLITPWFMNLMLLPAEEEWSDLKVGEKVTHLFHSGAYEFTVGYEAGFGRYQMCSLFSPMQQFVDQAAAEATAVEVMRGLLDSENREGLTMHDEMVRRAWQGGDKPEKEHEEDGPTLSEKINRPISRRELLRGRQRSE